MPDPFSTPVADPFMESGNAPRIKFAEVGEIHTLIVRKVDKKIDVDMDTNLPKSWPNGDPMHVFVFTGEGDDGDQASLWVRGNMITAIRDAVTAAGLPSVVDTKLTLKFDGLGTPPKKGLNAPKLFKAKVEKVAAAVASSSGGFDDEEPF